MEVKLDTGIVSISRVVNLPPKPKATASSGQEVSFGQTGAINEGLSQTPEVRPEEVERARALISTEYYPPQVIMQEIARLLAVMSDGSR